MSRFTSNKAALSHAPTLPVASAEGMRVPVSKIQRPIIFIKFIIRFIEFITLLCSLITLAHGILDRITPLSGSVLTIYHSNNCVYFTDFCQASPICNLFRSQVCIYRHY